MVDRHLQIYEPKAQNTARQSLFKKILHGKLHGYICLMRRLKYSLLREN